MSLVVVSLARSIKHPLTSQSVIAVLFLKVWRAEAENIRGREGLTIVAVKNVKETATPKDKQVSSDCHWWKSLNQ